MMYIKGACSPTFWKKNSTKKLNTTYESLRCLSCNFLHGGTIIKLQYITRTYITLHYITMLRERKVRITSMRKYMGYWQHKISNYWVDIICQISHHISNTRPDLILLLKYLAGWELLERSISVNELILRVTFRPKVYGM